MYINRKKYLLPVLQGKETQGANSLAVNRKTIAVVGGDFSDAQNSPGNIAISLNNANNWQSAAMPPNGYKSCIEFLGGETWIACGLTGVDISTNNCLSFKNISGRSFHVVRKAKKGNAVYFAGANGAIGKLIN